MKTIEKMLYAVLSMVLLCGIMVSCSNDDEDSLPEPKIVAQTIIVFQPYAENLTDKKFLMRDLEEMKSAIETNRVMEDYRVLVYYGSSATKAALYEMKLKGDRVVNDTIERYNSVVQNSETFLTGVFQKIKNTAPATTYKMMSEAHGSGWLPSNINYGSIPPENLWNWVNSKGMFKTIGGASQESLCIELSVFRNALTNSGIHLQSLILDNCLMSNIESIWDLKDIADYIVATPAEQPGDGFPYDKIWNDIIATTSIVSLKNICDSLIDYYDKKNEGYINSDYVNVSPVTISVINCKAIQQIGDDMKEINGLYPELTAEVLAKVQRYDMKKEGIFFDILSYAAHRIGPGHETDSLYMALKAAIDETVPVKMHGGYFLANGNECYPISKDMFSGLGCSDASQNTIITQAKTETSWWKATH